MSDPLEAEIAQRIAAVRERIARAAARVDRDPEEIRLVGVSKRQPDERLLAVLRGGVLDLGESYVQEAREKIPRIHALRPGEEPPRWRLVGRLQTNKARFAVELFDVIESVDRLRLARELDRRAEGADRRLEVLLQVSLCGEPQKGGALPDALPELLAACDSLERIRVVGLMTVPAASADPEAARPVFAQLRALRDRLREATGGAHLRELSMGMSGDFEVAIEEGATIVRVGTALFGERTPPSAVAAEPPR